ncbi:MAG: hypothetical protein ACPG77_06760 [Nannocystaceae bacterium]
MRRLGTLVLLVAGCSDVAATTTTTTTFTPYPDMPQPTWVSSTGGIDPSTSMATTGDDPTTTTSTTGHPDTSTVLPDFGPGDDPCGGKIDVLFVLDRHEAMGLNSRWEKLHAALEVAVPNYFDALANFDTHWMVVDGSSNWGDFACNPRCSETGGVTCTPDGPAEHPCAPFTDGSLTDCDESMGAGLTFSTGTGAANKRCEIGPNRYISSETEDPLMGLKCITTTGYSDRHGIFAELAMVEAVTPLMTGVPGGCNLGFLRSDALLFVVFVATNGAWEDWETSPAGLPVEWADALYEAKGGNKDKVAVLGIVTDESSEEPTVCEEAGGSLHGTEVESFLHNHIKWFVHGSLCADDYRPFFEQGLELALELCGVDTPR